MILAASKPGDLVLDPFFSTGTNSAVAKKLHRRRIGTERDEQYVRVASEWIGQMAPFDRDTLQWLGTLVLPGFRHLRPPSNRLAARIGSIDDGTIVAIPRHGARCP